MLMTMQLVDMAVSRNSIPLDYLDLVNVPVMTSLHYNLNSLQTPHQCRLMFHYAPDRLVTNITHKKTIINFEQRKRKLSELPYSRLGFHLTKCHIVYKFVLLHRPNNPILLSMNSMPNKELGHMLDSDVVV